MEPKKIAVEEVDTAYDLMHKMVHRTPILRSRLLDESTGCTLFVKTENFQRTGSFKMRGASHAVAVLSPEQKEKGVLTHSSGNFAQALALAAKDQGVKAYIVMPENAPKVKVAAVRDYGAEIITSGSRPLDREEMAEEVRQRTGATFIHPSNDRAVILGQATCAYEFHQDRPDLHVIMAPVGGGGLIAGTILATQLLNPSCSIIGAEPFNVDDAYRSLQSRKIETNASAQTIADGLRTNLGDINFPIILGGLERIIRVEEAEIIEAMQWIWERMKLVAEPSAAVPLAAVLKEKERFAGKKVGLILSGGNVDVSDLPF
ncbi:MAG: threonine/serine dehydratase [Bacteroidetes bacterium]|nr:threonine/serine dehydratase [Bacteroidota bacterium]